MLLRRLPLPLLFVLALLLPAVPARAQLQTGSAWQNVKSTDFLNLYQGTNTVSIKPEVLMLLDDSMSTWRMMFHPLFPNDWLDESPGAPSPNGSSATSDMSLFIDFTTPFPTASGTAANQASPLAFITCGFSSSGGTTLSTVTASGVNYTIGGARQAMTGSDGKTYYVNTLIGADGYEIGYANIPTTIDTYAASPTVTSTQSTTNPGKTDPINWMLCATHMRLLCSKVGSTTTTRVIDFPLPWAPLDPPVTPWYSAYNPAVMSGSATASVGPYPMATATDPIGGGVYKFDTQVPGVVPCNSSGTSTGTAPTRIIINGVGTGNTFIRSRYIEWCFVGKDPSSTGGAAYCIPNAIPSPTAADMYCVPATVYPYNPTINATTGLPNPFTPGPGYTYNGPAGAWQTTGWVQATTGTTAFSNLIPCRTRANAIKECVIKAWLNHQNDIMLAVRIFQASSTQTANNSLTSSTTAVPANETSNWFEFSPTAIATQVPLVAGMSWATDGTPLGQSVLGSMAQFTNPTAFKASIAAAGYSAAQLNCQHHFLIVLTDGASDEGGFTAGVPLQNTGASNYPYYQQSGTYANAAYTGNGLVATNSSKLTSTYWNLPTLAGIGAHGGDGSSTSPTWIQNPLNEYQGTNYTGNFTTVTSGGLVPFWVTQRTVGSTVVNLSPAQAIQTMTVGVSLGMDFYSSGTTIMTGNTAPNLNSTPVPIQLDYSAAKFELLASAAFGDPLSKNYVISSVVPFYTPYGTTTKGTDSVYYFDGRDPASLVTNLDQAFVAIKEISGVNSTSAPVFPTLGAGLGNEVYVGNFIPPVTPGPLWTGDLLAYPTTTTSVGTLLLTNTGVQVTGTLSAATAQWSAANVIGTRGWLNRQIYTRLPSNSSTWNTPILPVTLGSNGSTQTASFLSLWNAGLLPGATANLALSYWQFLVGADTSSGTSPLSTRTDSIMGDVIGSTPTVLGYATLPTSVSNYSAVLKNAWNTNTNPAFRVIFVGDNQGLFHAFGEVSWLNTTTNTSQSFTQSVADELWAFVPTEILPYINEIQGSGNRHYYAVDGAPTVYLLDLPQNSGQATGNGVYDAPNSYATERAIVVFGLGKGGRSYYAINVADPCNPTMSWALCPNEGTNNYPASRLGSGATASAITNMGLATSQPTFARVATSYDNNGTNTIIDACLLGGGYSDWNIESSLPATAVTTSNLANYPAANTLLGRSVVALDVNNGTIIDTWKLTSASAGPVMTGLVPVTLVAGSGITERAYFTDYYGSLWALGSTTLQSGTYNMLRTDTPIIDNWGARQIYCQTAIGSPAVAGNGVISTQPVPFLLPSSPVTVTASGVTYQPFTLGIAFETGDRNNPLDNFTYTQWSAPTASALHQLNVLFDRQDKTQGVNASTFTPSNLSNGTSSTFDYNPSDTAYYLNTTYGYYYPFPAPVANTAVPPVPPNFITKGITSPLVLEGNLFFSYFTPTTATCAGGTGQTFTFQVANVLAPPFNNSATWNTTNAANATSVNGTKSGLVLAWSGVASNMSARTILTGVQAGLTSSGGINDVTTNAQNLIIQNLNTVSSDRFPKIRVWRVVH